MVSWPWLLDEQMTDITYDNLLVIEVSMVEQGVTGLRACWVYSLNLSGASNHLLKRMVMLEKNIQLLSNVKWSMAAPCENGGEGAVSLPDIKDWMYGACHRLGLLDLGFDIARHDDRRLGC